MGCNTVVAKILSKEDDSKHQIYLSRGVPLAQILPGQLKQRGLSESETKKFSSSGVPIFSLELNFAWVDATGQISSAPTAKLIEYSQYPEVRFSGFLKNSRNPPRCLSGERQSEFGTRVLILGISGDSIYGTVCTEAGSQSVVSETSTLERWRVAPAMYEVVETQESLIDSDELKEAIARIISAPQKPLVLDPGNPVPKEVRWSTQAAGWTLEALLGVPRNNKPEPDKFGYELKAVGSSRVSLITTEADFGKRKEDGLREFLNLYGRNSDLNPKKKVFNGLHRAWIPNDSTRVVLEIDGWDRLLHTPKPKAPVSVVLRHVDTDEILAGWSLEKLAQSWTKKHSAAFYLQYFKAGNNNDVFLNFGPNALDCRKTSIGKFLEQLSRGNIFLDPGDSLSDGKLHSRTQWRINGSIASNLGKRLAPLYESVDELKFPSLTSR